MIAIGIMSGTSADGIDVAAIEIEPGSTRAVRVLAHAHRDYPLPIREAVLAAATHAPVSADALARLHAALGDEYASAAAYLTRGLPRRPDVIAMHGQTVAHLLPEERVTLQLGDATRVARATGVPTVADFRSADVAAGGEGAPLVPFADHVLFGPRAPIAILNVGGIANFTLLPSGDADAVIAFDTGPGNMASDAIVARLGERFDEGGRRARSGRVHEAALADALAHPFFSRRPPKSTGREQFGAAFAARLADRVTADGASLDDAVATAVAVTARSVADALRRETPAGTSWSALVVAGGGARNMALMEALGREVAPISVVASDALGVPTEAREAIAFAILGAFRIRELPNTLPRATGARMAVRAGAVHLP